MKCASVSIIIAGMLMLAVSAFAQTTGIGMPSNNTYVHQGQRDVPEYSILVAPTDIVTNYYDYMPGGYTANPMCTQPAVSHTMGYEAGGTYIVFHAMETAGSTRRVYWVYVDTDGTIANYGYVGSTDIKEGYPSVAIDEYSANPFVAFHLDYEGDDINEDVISSDGYSLLGSPGLWSTPAPVMDDDIAEFTAALPRPDNYYAWPRLSIGPSPLGEPYRRLYMMANLNVEHEEDYPTYAPMIAYADYNSHDNMFAPGELDWNYVTVPQLDAWDTADPDFEQCNNVMLVSSTGGTVVILGYGNMNQNAYAAVNTNYGEGNWEFYEQPMHCYVDNPQNQDGSYVFLDDNNEPYTDLQFTFTRTGNFSGKMVGNDAMFPCHFALRHNNDDDTFHWWYSLVYGKVIHFNVLTHEFSFQDLYPTGANPSDDNVMLPWDLDEDGAVDEFDEDGDALMVAGYPIFYSDYTKAGDYDNWKMVSNPTYNWMAVIWQDGLYARYANEGVEGYDDWVAKPQICVSISSDDGATWSEPITFNANPDDEDGNYIPELEGMIPEFVYGGDTIDYLYTDNEGNKHGKLHLLFLDDNSWGSFVPENDGENLGGMMEYMALDINFGPGDAVQPNEETKLVALQQNWPNPFNPTTTIGYSLANPGQVHLDVYNVRGQHVKTLYNGAAEAGNHTAIWNGQNDAGQKVASGVYFYRLDMNGQSQVKKMLLLK